MPRLPSKKKPGPKALPLPLSDLVGRSGNDEVETPDDLKTPLWESHGILFDPCPFPRAPWDGLEIDWQGSNFINPPYSDIKSWLKKGVDELKKGRKSVFLVTARVSSDYWWNSVYSYAAEVNLLRGGTKFKGYDRKFPVPLAVIVFDPLLRPWEKGGSPPQGTHSKVGKRDCFKIKLY